MGSVLTAFSPASVSLVTSLPGSASPSMSHSFGESYRVGSTSGVHAVTVFCSWDHKVTQRRASRLQHDNIRTHLKVSRSGALTSSRLPQTRPAST